SGGRKGEGRRCSAGAFGAHVPLLGHADDARVQFHDRRRLGRFSDPGHSSELSESAQMKPSSQETQIHLSPSFFPETGERLLVENEAFTVAAFRFPSGIEGLRAENRRGHIVILLWLGQMIWDAVFDGCRLVM